MKLTRRKAIQSMGLGILSINLPVWASQNLLRGIPLIQGIPLLGPDENGFFLPEGFTSRVIAKTGRKVSGTNYKWHHAPDGGTVVPTDDGGWIYVSNSESFVSFGNSAGGGVGAVRFDASGNIIDAYRLLSKTIANCAGGLTPWGTWLSCEEFDFIGATEYPDYFDPSSAYKGGRVWETFPLEPGRKPVSHPNMGVFQHEAAAFDPMGHVYLTEDQKTGCFYRYTPKQNEDLSEGRLEVAIVRDDKTVHWERILDPASHSTPVREQVKDATQFKGGEGAAYHDGKIFFTTKHDNKVWYYDVVENTMNILYDAKKSQNPQLTGVDNVTISPAGQVVVAEDGGNMELVGVNDHGEAVPILRLSGQNKSEITGPAFSPDGARLYLSSQRGQSGKSSGGITYEISGPFQDLRF